ncbi:hypothetical protein GCM10023147_14580 [Tsukamurella soli]|uniref:Uncharacterized protein n=1 Tax=Tsukamurella soli TaxID=644556 RepID=A0ABP8JCQ0_9ACTN
MRPVPVLVGERVQGLDESRETLRPGAVGDAERLGVRDDVGLARTDAEAERPPLMVASECACHAACFGEYSGEATT